MKSIYGVILTIAARFDSMLSTLGGFIWALCLGIFEFLIGYKAAIIVVFIAVLLDMVWGIAAARSQGVYTRSELMRETITKVSGYASALILIMLLENILLGSHRVGIEEGTDIRWGVDITAFVISCIETWSMFGNILIVNPKLVFFKIFRMSLVGEIARKLHRTEEEVKDILENNGDFKQSASNE